MCQLRRVSGHLALRGLSHRPQQALTFNTPWKELRTAVRSEARCALGKASSLGPHTVRYFQEKMLWTQLGASAHTWKSPKIVNGDVCSLWRHRSLLRRCVRTVSPSVSAHVLWPAPAPLGAVPQSRLRHLPAVVLRRSQTQLHSEPLRCPFFFSEHCHALDWFCYKSFKS